MGASAKGTVRNRGRVGSPRTLWDVLAGDAARAVPAQWLQPVGGDELEQGVTRPRPSLGVFAASVARQRIGAVVREQLAGDQLLDRFADVWHLYGDIAGAARRTKGRPGARETVPVGHVSNGFTHVVEVTVSYEGWTWTTQFDATLQLSADPVVLQVEAGAVAAVETGSASAEGRLVWERQELLMRRCDIDLQELLGPEIRLDLTSLIPSQQPRPRTIRLPES